MKDYSIELRTMYKDKFQMIDTPIPVYDSVAPMGSGSGPYCVIISIDFNQVPISGIQGEYIVTLHLYQEFREYGGTITLDNICQDILSEIIPDYRIPNLIQGNYLTKLVSVTNDVQNNEATNVFRKIIRIQHNFVSS